MPVAVCPKPETLAAFARGDLGAAELAEVAGHVGSCMVCCRALQLVPEDTLAGLARAAAAAPSTLNSAGPPAPPSPESIANSEIPTAFVNHSRYRLISQLGAGGMGTVYKAEDLLMGRIIALKVVSPHLTAKPSRRRAVPAARRSGPSPQLQAPEHHHHPRRRVKPAFP